MHSKWQIWDFLSNVKRDHLASFEGVLGLNTFDPVCLKLVKDYLLKGAGDRVIHHKLASEVNRGWIEDEFMTLGLFGNTDSFFIHQAQDLSSDLLEQLLAAGITGRFVILSFEADNALWKKIIKDNKAPTLQVEPPKFWEPGKLLDFVCRELRLPLSYEAKTWMLEALENNLPTLYNSCFLIKLNHPDAKEVDLVQVRDLVGLERLDQFALANLYARKKQGDFFTKLVQLSGDFDRMRGLFMFLQGHFIKMMDTSYLGGKARLTGYDKDLQSTAKLWKSEELLKEVRRFNRWELMSKKKDPMLWHELKEFSLRA